jgi:hypothetical protein
MARKRQYNTIRTDYLESRIAFYIATGRSEVANIFSVIARDVNAPVDKDEIEKLVAQYHKSLME